MKSDAGRMKEELKAALDRISELEAYIQGLTAAVREACPSAETPPLPRSPEPQTQRYTK